MSGSGEVKYLWDVGVRVFFISSMRRHGFFSDQPYKTSNLPPPAIVALINESSSSSPRIASCKCLGVIRFTLRSFEAFPANSRTCQRNRVVEAKKGRNHQLETELHISSMVQSHFSRKRTMISPFVQRFWLFYSNM